MRIENIDSGEYFDVEIPESVSEIAILALEALGYLAIGAGIFLGARKISQMFTEEAEISQMFPEEAENSLFLEMLPFDVKVVIISQLNGKDAANLAFVETGMPKILQEACRIKSTLAKNEIKKLLNLAFHFFNSTSKIKLSQDYINFGFKQNSYHNFFEFDYYKWTNVLTNLHKFNYAFRAEELMKECRLELVEALAKYNCDYLCFEENYEGDRFIPGVLERFANALSSSYQKELRRPIYNVHPSPELKEDELFLFNEILNEAKRTLVGNFKPTFAVMAFEVKYLSFGVDLSNREFPDWHEYKYPRFPKVLRCENLCLSIEQLLTMKNNRILLKSSDGEQVLLRFDGDPSIFRHLFEKFVNKKKPLFAEVTEQRKLALQLIDEKFGVNINLSKPQ